MDFKDFLNEMKQERDESLRKNCQSFNDFDESTDSIVKLNDETEHQRSHLQLDIGSDLKFTDLPSKVFRGNSLGVLLNQMKHPLNPL